MNGTDDGRIEGIYGALPLHFRELVLRERSEGNPALHDFLDIFQNRLIRFWSKDAEPLRLTPEEFEDAQERFGGEWLPMPESCRTRLGRVNSRLGADAITGKTLFDG